MAGVVISLKISPARFAPKHECKARGDDEARRAQPNRNDKPGYGDLPARNKSKQMRDGNNGEDSNCDSSERFHLSIPGDRVRTTLY